LVKCRDGSSGAAGIRGALNADIVGIKECGQSREVIFKQGRHQEGQDHCPDGNCEHHYEDECFFESAIEPANKGHRTHSYGKANDNKAEPACGDPSEDGQECY